MKTKIILFFIIFLSLILRFYRLGNNPPALDWDEASLGYNAYSILKTGRDEYGSFLPLVIRSFNDYKPPLYTYLTVLPVAFFGLTPISVRVTSAIFGVLAVAAVYYLVRLLKFPLKTALLTALFLSISPWHLQFSRVAFEANIALTLIIFAVLFFIKGISKGSYLVLASFFFGFSIYSYHSPRLLVPLFVAGLIIIFFAKLRSKLIYLSVFLILLSIFYLPVIKDLSRGTAARFSSVSVINPDEKLGESIKFTEYDFQRGDSFGKIMHNRRIIFGREILAGYLDHFNFDFLFLTGDAPGRHHAAGMGMLFFLEFPFIVVGLIYLLKNIKNTSCQTVLLWFLIAPVAASLTSGTPHAVRAIFYLPAYQIFTSFGILYALNHVTIKPFNKLLNVLITLLLMINFFYYFHQYYIHTPIEHAPDWQFGYKQAVESVNKYEAGVDRIIFTYKYDQPYVFFLFYNKINPSWYQGNWGQGEIDRNRRKFGKYEFRNIDWEKDKNLSNVLIVGTPSEIPENASGKVADIPFPDGTIAFRIVLK